MSNHLSIGDVLLDRYELVEQIGEGGFGTVFRAKQLGMNRDVAVKLLHANDDAEMRERFKREAMMARNLNHPHTIRQYDFGETDDGLLYLVLEFLDGVNLVQAIQRDGALGDDRVRHIAEGVLKSLGEAHAQGIVHRDLKPANIMICNVFGESDFPKVLDFGIAKTVHGNTDLTQAGVALGSPKYMAPEILQGLQPTPAADVYAVAITLAEAIIGAPLVNTANSVEAAQLQLSPKPLPVTDELRASSLYPWLSIALKKEPSERFRDAAEMLDYMHVGPEKLALRGADVPGAEGATTGKFEPAPDIDVHGETFNGTADDLEPRGELDATLPADGIDTSSMTGNADEFAKTEAFEAIKGPDQLGPMDETADSLQIGGAADDDATEMISLSDFEQQFGSAPTAEANPALTPTAEANPGLKQADVPTERHAAVDPTAMQPQETGQRQGFGSIPPGGLGPMPGIGQNAPSPAGDADRTEFVDLNSLAPTVSAEEKKSQKTLFAMLAGLVGIGLLALAGLAVFLYSMSTGSDESKPKTEPTKVVATETDEKVEVNIYAQPKVSAVVIDGQEKTKTPARFRIAKSKLPQDVTIEHPGYKPAKITLTPDGKNVFDVKLESALGGEKKDEAEKKDDGATEKEEEVAPAKTGEPKPAPKKRTKPRRKTKPKKEEPSNEVPLF